MFTLNKFSLIILTRCNLRCKLCCEYVPQNKPFPDMTVAEAERILASIFQVCDHITTLHLTGGGEPFLHSKLPELIEASMKYKDKFDRLMLFTNSVVPVKPELLNTILRYKSKILVQLSQYGLRPEYEQENAKLFLAHHVNCKIETYYGDDQRFGGWVDFGKWEHHNRTPDTLACIYQNCSVTKMLEGNWRTRDGKVHWCTRSQRGMELGFLPDCDDDYIDLFDGTSIEDKRIKFESIRNVPYLSACDYCSGDAGTNDKSKRFKAAEQMEVVL